MCNLPGMGEFVNQELPRLRIRTSARAERVVVSVPEVEVSLAIHAGCGESPVPQAREVGDDDVLIGQ